MTPIGHFICSSAVAGNIDLLEKKEVGFCFLYYLLFFAVFWASVYFLSPGHWVMQLHDQFGNLALLFFLIFWLRKDEKRQYFVCVLIGSQILAAYTHVFDGLALKLLGEIPDGMWRPHNILHTPLAGLVISLVVLPLLAKIMRNRSYRKIYFYLVLGYFLHIFTDTITYNYQIYPFWPLSGLHFSLISFFQAPDAVSRFLGNPLYIFSPPSVENIDGFIVYRAEVLINILLGLLYVIKLTSARILASNDRK